ncbi:MAG: hypothetical protein IPJ84_01755 [Bdellovibrionales bacterium]|nr:hypothetical protein [Bdellovibrionales bacterium]
MNKMMTILGVMMFLSTGFAADEATNIEKVNTKFQKVCEVLGKNLPKEYQPKYTPAEEIQLKDGQTRRIAQGCQIYSVGFDQAIDFRILESFNIACEYDDSTNMEVAPAPCNDNLKTCVLNVRCGPKN